MTAGMLKEASKGASWSDIIDILINRIRGMGYARDQEIRQAIQEARVLI